MAYAETLTAEQPVSTCHQAHLSAMTDACDCHAPMQNIVAYLGIVFIQLIEFANLEK